MITFTGRPQRGRWSKSLPERFWEKVNRFPESGSCWEWMAYKNNFGHGMFAMQDRPWHAHQVAFVLFGGAIKPGYDLHHVCENPGCVNPEHLQQLTRKEHAPLSRALRENGKATIAQILKRREVRTHCRKGLHQYTDADQYPNRKCGACMAESQKRSRENRRQRRQNSAVAA